MDWDIIVTVIVGLGGGAFGALITSASQRRKVHAEANEANARAEKARAEAIKIKAEADDEIRNTVMLLVDPLRKRIEELENELKGWKNWANRLVNQIKGMGCEPVPFEIQKGK